METANTSTAVLNATRNLPTILTGEVERLGYSLLRGLDRLGFIHETKTGDSFTVRFSAVRLYGDQWAAYQVDAERLYHFSVADLARPAVLSQLSALGVGRAGPVWVGLPKLGHTLLAGTTGSGKSTLLHSALAALLTGAGPDRLRVALVDPKRSEFTAWAGVPHLLGRIAHTTDQASDLLGDLVAEVDRRGDLLAGALVRDLGAYNRKAAEPLPYILAMVDECLDLVLDAGNKSELAGYLKSLAIRGRSAGVFLWAATQHGAAVTGMPRVVNTNLTTRLVFRVADDSAARVAGCPGAETLPRDKPGRLLAKIDHDPQELQGYTLSDDALLAVARGLAGEDADKLQRLPDGEAALVRYAVDTLQGFFVVNRLAAAFAGDGVTSHKVKTLAQRWERRGLLTTPKHATDARRVTPALCALAGLTAQADA